MVAQLGDAGIEKALDRVAGLPEHTPVRRKARPFQREHEARRYLTGPFAKRRRRLRAVERAVDLDRGQPLGGICKFLRMRQPLRIEQAAPRRKGPAAHPDVDPANADFPWFWSHRTVTKRCYIESEWRWRCVGFLHRHNGHGEIRRRRMNARPRSWSFAFGGY